MDKFQLFHDYVSEWIDIENVVLYIKRINSNFNKSSYFIEHSYIDKNYRRNGLMTMAIKNYVSKHGGIYYLDIINDNIVAKKFWESIGKLHICVNSNPNDDKCTSY